MLRFVHGRDGRQLAITVKERQMEADAAALAALRVQHEGVTVRNKSMTDREKALAEDRENVRERYVEHLRESAEQIFRDMRALRRGSEHEADGGTLVDELSQMVGEFEAGVDAIASVADAHDAIDATHLLEALDSVGKALHERLELPQPRSPHEPGQQQEPVRVGQKRSCAPCCSCL
jgi:hypothetical protein